MTTSDRMRSSRAFLRRALLAEGVQRVLASPTDGFVFGLIGNGRVRVTGSLQWHKVMKVWREETDPPDGWRAISLLDPVTRRPVVIMSAQSLGRLLAVTEQMAAESGRLSGE